jgi:hypothetical protein
MSRLTEKANKQMVQLHMQHFNSALSHLAALGPQDGVEVCQAILSGDGNALKQESLGNWMDWLEKLRPRLILKIAGGPPTDQQQPPPPNAEPTLFDFLPTETSAEVKSGATEDASSSQLPQNPQPYASFELPPPPLQTLNECADQLGSLWQAHFQHAPRHQQFIQQKPF